MTGSAIRTTTARLMLVALAFAGAAATGVQLPSAGAQGPLTAAAPGLFPAPGEFLYVRSHGAWVNCRFGSRPPMRCRLSKTFVRESWQSERHVGLLRERPARSRGMGRMKLQILQLWLGNRRFSHAQLAAYSPTGASLLAELQTGRVPGQGGDTATYPFVQLTDALREASMPPAVRRAVIDALPLVPGVEALGARKDSLGRSGISFARSLNGVREEVTVDPLALVMLEERRVILERRAAPPGSGLKIGDQIGGATYVQRAVVSRVGQRP